MWQLRRQEDEEADERVRVHEENERLIERQTQLLRVQEVCHKCV